jgi:ubiquinone/menaquinone biosynthesis C-methylase UbiE
MEGGRMKDQIRSHWNGRASGYDKNVRHVIFFQRDKTVWQRIFAELLGEDHHRILDVGTGPGIVANLISGMGYDVTGIDASERMLAKARENSATLHNSVELVLADAENLPFSEASFDAVVNRYVLWSLPDPKSAIAQWHRVLRPGGRLVVVDGNWYLDGQNKPWTKKLWALVSMALAGRRWPGDQNANDGGWRERLWSSNAKRPEADIEMLRELGFKDIQVTTNLNRRLLTTLDYLKWGHSGDQFLVTGVK